MKKLTLCSLALGLSALGCSVDNPLATQALDTLAPVTFAGDVLFVERTSRTGYLLELSGTEPSVRTTPVGTDATVVQPRAGHPEALVLSRGSRGDESTPPEDATLTTIAASAGTASRQYTLGSPFNAIDQTPDGRFALAHYAPSSTLGRLLFNPNELALIDLEQAPSASNPRLRTVRSFGGVPSRVVFSPPLRLHGEDRTLAVVLSDAYLTLLDLSHPERAEVTVRLTLPEDPRSIAPSQVLFDPPNLTLYVRGDSSDDVYVLQLSESTAVGSGNDFRPSVNQLAAGRGPSDMALFGPDDARRVLVTSPGSREVRAIDARSNTVLTLALDARADRVLLFQGTSPRDPTTALRAFLYAADGATTATTFLDLGQLDARGSQNLETLQLNQAIVRALPLTERRAVMLEHRSDAVLGRLSLLDLQDRTASPILAEVSLDNAAFDADHRELWVAPQGTTRLGYLDLASFHPGEVRLDAAVTQVLALVDDPLGRNRVLAVHAAAEGWVTVLDASAPQRASSFSMRGFLLTNLLGRGATP